MIEIIQKFHKDLTILPGTRELITKLTEFFVGGNPKSQEGNPIYKSALIINSVCKFGFSMKLAK
jgi:hypothetical protein